MHADLTGGGQERLAELDGQVPWLIQNEVSTRSPSSESATSNPYAGYASRARKATAAIGLFSIFVVYPFRSPQVGLVLIVVPLAAFSAWLPLSAASCTTEKWRNPANIHPHDLLR